METFLENARRIFEVACGGGSAETSDFALLVRPDGSLHMVMESEMNLDAVAVENGARIAYRVSRSPHGVRVTGRNGDTSCELSNERKALGLLRDQPLYLIASA